MTEKGEELIREKGVTKGERKQLRYTFLCSAPLLGVLSV